MLTDPEVSRCIGGEAFSRCKQLRSFPSSHGVSLGSGAGPLCLYPAAPRLVTVLAAVYYGLSAVTSALHAGQLCTWAICISQQGDGRGQGRGAAGGGSPGFAGTRWPQCWNTAGQEQLASATENKQGCHRPEPRLPSPRRGPSSRWVWSQLLCSARLLALGGSDSSARPHGQWPGSGSERPAGGESCRGQRGRGSRPWDPRNMYVPRAAVASLGPQVVDKWPPPKSFHSPWPLGLGDPRKRPRADSILPCDLGWDPVCSSILRTSVEARLCRRAGGRGCPRSPRVTLHSPRVLPRV